MYNQEIRDKIKQRRLQMLVHSCIYYVLDSNIVSDSTWSKWALELRDLQNKYPEISKEVEYAEYFKDWDGSSGAFLPIHEDWVMQKAHKLISLHKEPAMLKPKIISTKTKKSSMALF